MPNQPNARKAKSTPAFAKPPTGPPRRPSASGRRSTAGDRRPSRAVWVTVAVVAVLAVAAGVIAIISSGGSSTASIPPGVEQTQPVTVGGAALPTLPASGVDPAVGQTAPTLSGLSFDGTTVDVRPDGTSATLVVFLAHWCPHCQRELPKLVQWDKDGKVPAGVRVIGIATQTSSSQPNYPPSTWLSTAGFPWPIMADSPTGDAATALGIDSWPGFVLLDKDGTVLWRSSGEIDVNDLAAKITAALPAASPTATPSTAAAPAASGSTSAG